MLYYFGVIRRNKVESFEIFNSDCCHQLPNPTPGFHFFRLFSTSDSDSDFASLAISTAYYDQHDLNQNHDNREKTKSTRSGRYSCGLMGKGVEVNS